MSEIVEVLNEIVERHDCSHLAIVSKASAEITSLTAEVDRLLALTRTEAQYTLKLEAEITTLRADNKRLRAALEAALEDGVGVSYCDEDECGNYDCCGEVSYKPHAPDCWTLKARAALSGDKHE